MTRPAVSVVMPFAGDRAAAHAAIGALHGLRRRPDDELILADNAGTVAGAGDVQVVSAPRERSPAHARNCGAAVAACDWILFLDADCRPAASLLDDFFSEPVQPRVGALAGEVVAVTQRQTLASRYAVSRDFLSQRAHLGHPYLPRAVAANLLVRADAFRSLGGFTEGLRAAEDTDFCWRLQRAGWQLELRPGAAVEHLPRLTVRGLRAQWRGYAAGRAWLSRRYAGFRPEPALLRALGRVRPPRGARTAPVEPARRQRDRPALLRERIAFLALDIALGLEELRGLTGSNRPVPPAPLPPGARVVIAARYPAEGHERPAPEVVRAEALSRTSAGEAAAVYAEDDGFAERISAALRSPMRLPRVARGNLGGGRPVALAAMAWRVRAAELQPLADPDSRRLAAVLRGSWR